MTIPSPRSSHLNNSHPTTQHSNGLQLLDTNHLPIVYPSPVPSSKQRVSSGNTLPHGDENYIEEIDDGDDGEWVLEHEYVDVNAADAAVPGYGIDPYLGAPVRPRPVHRESQDVEFGNRLTPTRRMRMRGRSRGHAWEVNMHLPHMPMKGLTRGKTALLKTLRGGLARVHSAGHGHSPSGGNSPPTFEFRDPQPMPQSIRQQYAELAPSDSAPPAPPENEMRKENGLLAPPAPANGPKLLTTDKRASLGVHDTEAPHRHLRSQSASYHSQSRVQSSRAQTPRPRSRSVASHRSAASEATVTAHSTQSHGDGAGTAETTLVQHINDAGLMPIYRSPSKSPKSSNSKASSAPQRSNTLSSVRELRVPNPVSLARSRSQNTRKSSKPKAPLIRALQAFQRLPWIANPEYPPGALIPTGSPPRIAKDFIPARSARAKLRDETPPGSGVVYAKKGVDAAELEEEEDENPSWYRPSTRQIQRNMRTQYAQRTYGVHTLANGVGGINITRGGMGPVKQAYVSYRAASGRPLGYMYASPMQSRRASTATGSAYSTTRRQYSGSTRAGGSAGVYGVTGSTSGRGQIAAAASAYLSRSASTSQASSPSRRSEYAGSAQLPPPVPPKSVSAQPTSQQQQRLAYSYTYPATTGQQPIQYYTYNFAYPQTQPYARSHVPGSSPPLPPLPPASYSLSYAPTGASASAHSHQAIPTIPSESPSAATHASSYSHGSSGDMTTSGYGTVLAQAPVRYLDYSYSYMPR